MINIFKKKNKIKRELLSKIEWACSLNSIKFEHEMLFEGCLRIIEHTNLAYVEPHRVIIKDKLFLFFNECDYFYVGDLRYKYPLSQTKRLHRKATLILEFFCAFPFNSERRDL